MSKTTSPGDTKCLIIFWVWDSKLPQINDNSVLAEAKIFKPLLIPDKTVYILRSAPKMKTMIFLRNDLITANVF